MHSGTRRRPRQVPAVRRNCPSINRLCKLEHHVGSPMAHAREEAAQIVHRSISQVSAESADIHGTHALRSEDLETTGRHGIGVAKQDVNLGDASCDQRGGAGWCAPSVCARLKGHDRDRTPGTGSRRLKRQNLCMRTTKWSGRALADDSAFPNDDTTDRRVRPCGTRD